MGIFRNRRTQRGQALTEFALIVPLAILLVLGAYDTSVMASDKVIATTAVRNGARLGAILGGLGTVAPPNTCSGAAPATLTMAGADQEIILTVLSATRNMTFLGGGTGHAGVPDEIDIYRPSSPGGKLIAATDPYESYLPEVSVLTTPLTGGTRYVNPTLGVSPALSAGVAIGAAVVLTVGTSTQTMITRAAVPAGATNIPVITFTANANYGTTTTVYPPSIAFSVNHHSPNNYTMAIRCQGPLGNEAEIGVRMAWTYKPANGIPGPVFVFDDLSAVGHLPAEWAVEKESLCAENCLIQ